MPGRDKSVTLTMCRLDALGELGYDRRDIHDAFEVSYEDWSAYPAFWGHEAASVTTLAQKPTAKLIPRTKAARGRKLKDSKAVWAKAGNILLVERLRSNTHRVLAIGFKNAVLGNTWWSLKDSGLSREQKKALLLWLNSSLALLLFFGRRVITQGAWMQMKKPAWSSMPVLDVRALSGEQLKALAASYDELSIKSLLPTAQLDDDPVRKEIDAALAAQLKLPDLQGVRELLAREPGFSAEDIAAEPDDNDDGEDE
ncbi:hypothetical protein ACVI1J_005576 [Bradyrhizobium diazoefficiens]